MESIHYRTRQRTRLESGSEQEATDDPREAVAGDGLGTVQPTAMMETMETADEEQGVQVSDGGARPGDSSGKGCTIGGASDQSEDYLGEELVMAPCDNQEVQVGKDPVTQAEVNDLQNSSAVPDRTTILEGPGLSHQLLQGQETWAGPHRKKIYMEDESLPLEWADGEERVGQPIRRRHNLPWDSQDARRKWRQSSTMAPAGDGEMCVNLSRRIPNDLKRLQHQLHGAEGADRDLLEYMEMEEPRREASDPRRFQHQQQGVEAADRDRPYEEEFIDRPLDQEERKDRMPRSWRPYGARRAPMSGTSSSDDEGSYIGDVDMRSSAKLPPFDGKERWETWLNRFKTCATSRKWSDERKLDEMLPLMHGKAGDYVYGQLDEGTRNNYNLLVEELTLRYRTVEPRRSMGAKFSHRDQKSREGVRDYAAELKMLYDKAYPGRNRIARKEDLLQRFLDGLSDEDASFYVEYVKEPEDIEEAVDEVIHFIQARRNTGCLKRSKEAPRDFQEI